MQSNTGVNLQFTFVDADVRPRQVPNSSTLIIIDGGKRSLGKTPHHLGKKQATSPKLGANTSFHIKEEGFVRETDSRIFVEEYK
jgi:hypothetical protein